MGKLAGTVRYCAAALALAVLALTHAFRGQAETPAPVLDTPALREAAQVERSLTDLEAKLTQGEQWVAESSQLKERHERVSALVCTAAVAQQNDATRLAREKAARRHHRPLDDDSDGHMEASTSVASRVVMTRRTANP